MRIYALYERRKRVLVISMVLIVLTVGALQVFGAYCMSATLVPMSVIG